MKDIQINSDGSMNVTETWDIYISDTNTLFKTFKTDSSKYSNITDVKVKEITDGQNNDFTQIDEEMYHVTKNCYYGLTNSSGDFEISADKITGTILLPENAENKEDILVWGHTEDLNGTIYVTDLNKIEFEVTDYSGYSYVEVRSLFPRDMVNVSNKNYSTKYGAEI